MREKKIEAKLAEEVRQHGGLAPKFTSPGFDGMPDRIVLMPGGHMAFVEKTTTAASSKAPASAESGICRIRPG